MSTSIANGFGLRTQRPGRRRCLVLVDILRWWADPSFSSRSAKARLRRSRSLRFEQLESRQLLALTTVDLGQSIAAQDLAQALAGTGISVSNVEYRGSLLGAGLFSGGQGTGIGIASGVVLSSGKVASAVGPNVSSNTSTILGEPGDADLDRLAGARTVDASVLEFDVTMIGRRLTLSFVFASEEYNYFVGRQFNDVVGIFVNGVNVALAPGTESPVSVNTINATTNSQYFVNNGYADFLIAGLLPPFNIAANGFTTLIQATVDVGPGTHRIKFAVADTMQAQRDAWLFLPSGSVSASRTVVEDLLELTPPRPLPPTATGNAPFEIRADLSSNIVFAQGTIEEVPASIRTIFGTGYTGAALLPFNSGETPEEMSFATRAGLPLAPSLIEQLVVRANDDLQLHSLLASLQMEFEEVALYGAIASISGTVWHDLDGDGHVDLDELPLIHRQLFVDLNGNGQFDQGEPTVITNADGFYRFADLVLESGDYEVRLVLTDKDKGFESAGASVARQVRIDDQNRDIPDINIALALADELVVADSPIAVTPSWTAWIAALGGIAALCVIWFAVSAWRRKRKADHAIWHTRVASQESPTLQQRTTQTALDDTVRETGGHDVSKIGK